MAIGNNRVAQCAAGIAVPATYHHIREPYHHGTLTRLTTVPPQPPYPSYSCIAYIASYRTRALEDVVVTVRRREAVLVHDDAELPEPSAL